MIMFDLLFPTYCINCGMSGEYLCTKCRKKLKNNLPECYICRRLSEKYSTHPTCNKFNLDAVFIGWQYDEIARKLIVQYKYRYAHKLAKVLTKLLINRLIETHFIDSLTRDTIIIPVPIHTSHYLDRGFNQSSLIGKQIADYCNCQFIGDIIHRVGSGEFQSKSSVRKRESLGEVFKLKKKIQNKDILIIDDVITTGTTLNRVAKTLKDNRIKAIALFRGHPRYPTPQ